MPLQPKSVFSSDTVGSTESIALQPVPPARSTQITIASAFYGTDASGAPVPVTVSAKGNVVTLTMLPGFNALTVTLVSPDPALQAVNLVQAGTVLATPIVKNHSGFSTMFLQGV